MTSLLTPVTTPGAESTEPSIHSIRFMEALYLLTVLQTVLFNPVLLSIGGLNLYLCAISWPILACAAVVQWMSTDDPVLLGANRRLTIVAWVAMTAIGIQVLLMGLQRYTLGSFVQMLYVPIGVLAALAVYRRIEWILDVTLGIVGVQCAVLIIPRIGTPLDLYNRLNPAGLGGRNNFGAFLMILIVLRISVWAYTRERPPLYVLAGLGASLIALVLTLARSPALALVVGLAAVSVSALRRRGITGRSIRFGLLGGAVLSPLMAQPAVRDRLTSLSLSNSSGRNDVWDAALDMFRRRPALGNGFGSFHVTSPHIVENFVSAPSLAAVDPAVGQPTSSAHNVLLQILAEGGLVGLVVVAWSVSYLLSACWHAVLTPVVIAIVVDALFDTFAYVVQVSWVLGLVVAVGLKFRAAAANQASAAAGAAQ